MTEGRGNGDAAHGFPARMGDALRAARSGRYVSLDVLRGAVCDYIDELIALGMGDDEILRQVTRAFQEAGPEAPLDPESAWTHEFVDELISWCRERAPKS